MSKLIILLGFLSVSVSTLAGDKVGNGGGLWTCSVQQNLQINLQSGMLVDLYEAEVEFSLPLITTTELDPMKIVEERLSYIQSNLPGYYWMWNQVLADSRQKIHFVNSELTIVDDALYRVKPLSSTCPSGWVYSQFANFTNQDQILIRSDFWKSPAISSLHKAALIWHEVIYSWLRTQYQDKDSVRARQIVGVIFSTLPAGQMNSRIEKVLTPSQVLPTQPTWFCMVKNMNTFMNFGDYGMNQLEASSRTVQKCQNSLNGFHCDETGVQCSELSKQSAPKVCQLKNYQNNRTYLGKGYSVLEAEYKSREQCQMDTNTHPVHCDTEVVCQ